jgi:hypothetical protein
MSDPISPTVRIVLDVPRGLIQQLADQLWPPDPTLADDLRAIREKYLGGLPEDAAPDSTAA